MAVALVFAAVLGPKCFDAPPYVSYPIIVFYPTQRLTYSEAQSYCNDHGEIIKIENGDANQFVLERMLAVS